MRRTTIYLDTELETLLKIETIRRGKPMAELIPRGRNYGVHTRAIGRICCPFACCSKLFEV